MTAANPLAPIPVPPRKFYVGNLTSLDQTAPMQSLLDLAKEMGPIFWLDMMGAPIIFVWGADLMEELSDEKRFD